MNLLSFFNEYKNGIIRQKIPVILLLIIFLFSIVCGIVLTKPEVINEYYLVYCDNYVYRVFSTESGIGAIFLGRFLKNLLNLIIIAGGGVVIFIFPVHVFLVFYNGYVFGAEFAILCTGYSVNGFFMALFLFLPQYLILGGILITSAPFSLECGVRVFKEKNFYCVKIFLWWIAFFFILALAACVLEVLTVVIFFRPFAWAP